MDTHTQWKLIQRYVTGKAFPQERHRLEQWMDQDPINERLVLDVKQIWELTPEEDFDLNIQDAWERFNHRKAYEKAASVPIYSKKRQLYSMVNFFRAAAVILVMLLAGFFVQYYSETNRSTEAADQFYVMQELVTEKGEKAKVTFSDGTEVMLNAASTLQFPKKFQGPKREIYLDGEAYFKVAPDLRRPFVVHAGDATIQVLGTEFNVRGWSEEAQVDVAVREGKVSVNPSNAVREPAKVILTKDQFTRVKEGQNPEPVRHIDVSNHLLWTSGGLHFDNTPFEQVVRDIERKFGVQINVTDNTLIQVPFTGTFKGATELNEILKVVAAAMELEYSRKGSEIRFR